MKWTFAVYMAADNNLDAAVARDLEQMAAAGFSDEVGVFIQLDDRSSAGAVRRVLTANGFEDVESVDEVNTGSAESLARFLEWVTAQGGERLCVVLWGHGSGWSPPGKAGIHQFFAGVDTPLSRWYGIDESSGDVLDTLELLRALDAGLGTTAQIDILGFDACLMASAELAFELSGFVECIVASPTLEPTEGWPYSRVIKGFTQNPERTTLDIAKTIVDQYVVSYELGEQVADQPVSASVLAPQQFGQLAFVLDGLGSRLARFRDAGGDIKTPFLGAIASAWSYKAPHQLDIGSFAREMRDGLGGSPPTGVKEYVSAVQLCLGQTDYCPHRKHLPNPGGLPAALSGFSTFVPPKRPRLARDRLRAALRDLRWHSATSRFYDAIDSIYWDG